MGMSTSSGGIQSDINITPLVDVVLVLLIIFMVAQPKVRHGYDSAIPKPDPNYVPPPGDPPPTFVLKLGADSNGVMDVVKLNNDNIPRVDLVDRARTQMATVQDRDKVVFIDCGDTVNYNDLMRVVDDLRMAGVRTIGFATEPIAT